MEGKVIRTLAQYIVELHRRDRDDNGASECPAFDTTTEDDSNWSQGHSDGDDGHSQHSPGQSGNNIR